VVFVFYFLSNFFSVFDVPGFDGGDDDGFHIDHPFSFSFTLQTPHLWAILLSIAVCLNSSYKKHYFF